MIGVTTVLVVTDEGIRQAGLLEKVILSLEDAGIEVDIFAEVTPDPTVKLVERGAAIVKQKGHDLIIAVGGGSSIDAAKGVAVMATNEGSICDFEGVDKFTHKPLPVFAVPTTVGTGSEVTFGAVLTDTTRNYKFLVYGDSIAPQVAFLDPVMVSTAPTSVIIPTGMDALTHAIESYISLRATPQTEALAIGAIKLIAANLRQVVANSGNLGAVGNMLTAANLAGIAFGNSRLGIIHAMALPLGAFFHVPHGIANTVLLPYGLEFNLIATPQKYVDIASAMGEITIGMSLMDAAEKAIAAVKKLAGDIGAPKLTKEDGLIDWNKSAIQIRNLVRGTLPWPGAYTYFGEGQLLKVLSCSLRSPTPSSFGELTGIPVMEATPGTIYITAEKEVAVKTGEDVILLKTVQPANKKPMNAADFINGYRIKTGDHLFSQKQM